MEELKPVPSCPGYSVTKDGWAKGKRGQWLCGGTVDGYKTYRLQTSEGIRSTVKASRLVLETYVGSCPPGMQAHHKNGNRQDDRLENLVWATPQENMQAKTYSGGAIKSGPRKLTTEQVTEIRSLLANGVTRSELANRFGVCYTTIRSIHSQDRYCEI